MSATQVTSRSNEKGIVEAGPFRVSFATFAPEVSIASHFHERACISVLLEGRFEQRFPGKTLDCPPGVVLAKPPQERHVDRWFGAWSRHLIVEVEPERHAELGASRGLVERVSHVGDVGADVLAGMAWSEWTASDALTPLALQGLVFQLLARVARRDEQQLRGESPLWLAEVRDYLNDNFASTITLSELVGVAGVRPDHLSRVFSGTYGTTVAKYVRSLRVDAVERYLATTDESLSAIAFRCGFSDQSHMTRVFKKTKGVPPGRYRAAIRGARH